MCDKEAGHETTTCPCAAGFLMKGEAVNHNIGGLVCFSDPTCGIKIFIDQKKCVVRTMIIDVE